MARYMFGFNNYPSSGTTAKTAMKVAGLSGRQFEVNWIHVWGAPNASPQDFAYEAAVGWLSNATIGTPGSVTVPIKLDYTGPTATNSCGIVYTAEPTAYDSYVVPLFGHNHRGGMLFQVPRDEGFISDPASAYGLGVRTICNTSGALSGSMIFNN